MWCVRVMSPLLLSELVFELVLVKNVTLFLKYIEYLYVRLKAVYNNSLNYRLDCRLIRRRQNSAQNIVAANFEWF